MDCPRCRKAAPDESRYCNHCGLPLASYAPAAENEVELWRGRPSIRAFVTPILLWSLWSAGVLVAALLAWSSRQEWDPRVGWGAALLVAAPVGYMAAEIAARKMAVSYALTSRRLFVEEGFLMRRLQETDLLRIDDVVVLQSLPQRLADVGDVVLYSSDATTPRVRLMGVERPMSVKETIRERAAELRRGLVQARAV